MDIKIKAATELELPAIVELNKQVQHQHHVQYPDDFIFPAEPDQVYAFFKSVLEDDSQKIVVAECNQDITSYLWYQHQKKPASAFSHRADRLYIHHVIVDEKYRRLGIAKTLFDYVDKEAVQIEDCMVALASWAKNTDAHDFFRSMGFETYSLQFRKKL